mmetsp:Transcript_21945/g.32673  ORF Transcript_21945/g.32673 Transcript_21945/m.32673 type:complete len:217 (-) Transcript_21945:1962-2612(-)
MEIVWTMTLSKKNSLRRLLHSRQHHPQLRPLRCLENQPEHRLKQPCQLLTQQAPQRLYRELSVGLYHWTRTTMTRARAAFVASLLSSWTRTTILSLALSQMKTAPTHSWDCSRGSTPYSRCSRVSMVCRLSALWTKTAHSIRLIGLTELTYWLVIAQTTTSLKNFRQKPQPRHRLQNLHLLQQHDQHKGLPNAQHRARQLSQPVRQLWASVRLLEW